MKRAVLLLLLIIIVSLAACANTNDPPKTTPQPNTEETPAIPDAEETPDFSYEFEFEDINGNVHKLSDYKGMPVYLEVWGSWCGVCVSSLPDMNEFAGEEHDFAVLTVVTPGVAGEKSKEDFIEWYKGLGYDNLIVMLDEKRQIITDFGVSAYPSQLMFDADGNFVDGFVGLIPKQTIIDIMKGVADGTYSGL